MSFALTEVFPSSSVSSGALIPAFDSDSDFLAVGRGNILTLYRIAGNYLADAITIKLYGEIMKIIPLSFSLRSNILVILTDMRSSVLSWDENNNEVTTISSGNLMPVGITNIPEDLKYAVTPSALVVQFHPYLLTVFPITPQSSLGTSFPISIKCKSIMDFVFIGPISKVTRLAVLTEEYSDNPKLHLIEIDLTNNMGTEDAKQTVSLPENTYIILPFLPDTNSTVFCCSSQNATHVIYAAGLAPACGTHTLFTPNRLKWYAQMKDNLYAFIDEIGNIRVAELSENNTIHFTNLPFTCSTISCVVPISSTGLFVGSRTGKSYLFKIRKNSLEILQSFDSASSLIEFEKSDDSLIAVSKSAITKMDPLQLLKKSVNLQAKGIVSVWCKHGEEQDQIVLSSCDHTFFLEGADGVYQESENTESRYITDSSSLYVSFDPFIQVTRSETRIDGIEIPGDFIFAHSNGELLVLVDPLCAKIFNFNGEIVKEFEGEYTCACFSKIIKHHTPEDETETETEFDPIIEPNSPLSYFILCSPSEITIYNDNFEEIKRVLIKYPVISSIYDKNNSTFILAHARDYVSLLSPENGDIKEIYAPGYHTSCQIIHDKPVVFGEQPIQINGFEKVLYGQDTFISGYELTDDQIMLVGRNGIAIANEGRKTTTHNSYTDESKTPHNIEHIKKYKGVYIMSYHQNLGFTKDFASNERKTFFTADENILNLLIIEDLLIAVCPHNIYAFSIENPESYKLLSKEQKFDQLISFSGIFQNLLYIVFPLAEFNSTTNSHTQSVVRFYCVERLRDTCVFEEYTSFKLDNTITAVAAHMNLFACAFEGSLVRVFSMEPHSPQYKEIASSTVNYEITSLCFKDNYLIGGTQNGAIVIMSMTLFSTKQIAVDYASSVNSAITCIQQISPTSLIIGTESGRIYELQDASFPEQFTIIYNILEMKLYSQGHFNKKLEHAVYFKNVIGKRETIVDVDLLFDYLNASVDIQNKVFEKSDFNRDDVIALLKFVLMQLDKSFV